MKTAFFSKMAYCSRNVFEKQAVSNNTNFSAQTIS